IRDFHVTGVQTCALPIFVAYATENDIALLHVDDYNAIPGHGIKAKISGKHILVGNRKLMQDHGINTAGHEQKLVDYETTGKTAMMIAVDGQFRGIVAVADTIKESAPEAIKQLQDMGIEVVMLTGDNERTAAAI